MTKWQFELFLRGMIGRLPDASRGTINSNWVWYWRGQNTAGFIALAALLAVTIGVPFLVGRWTA